MLAGALAFSFVLCLAPLALLSMSAIGFLLTSEQITEYVLEAGSSLLPRYGPEMVNVVSALLRERRVNGLLAVTVLAVVATQLFSLARTIANLAFRVGRPRGLVHGFLFDLLALAVLGVVAVMSASVIVAAIAIRDATRAVLPPPPEALAAWARTPALVLAYASVVVLLFLGYRTLPNTPVPTRAAAQATLIVTALWETARQAVALYLVRFTPYGTLYGSFGALVAVLAWTYVSAALFVWGAYLTAAFTGGGPVAAAPAPGEAARPRARTALVYGATAASASLLVLVSIQNLSTTPLHLFHWTIDAVPLAAAILVSFFAGVLIAALLVGPGRRAS